MDSEHLRFNQSDGSVSLMVQPGFLAKNQLPSMYPDPIVIPNLAHISNREHPDRLLCPIRALKFYLKMTKPYHQNRTRLFLPIKGKQDISKCSVLRWMSYTIKLAYRKLTCKDFSFLKIKVHEFRALSSSWAFFDKVPLNKILKAAVRNQSSTFLSKGYVSATTKPTRFGTDCGGLKSGGGPSQQCLGCLRRFTASKTLQYIY